MEKLALQTCGNNVFELTTKMSDLRENIVTQRGSYNAYGENRFLTLLFKDLTHTTNPNFGIEVKLKKLRWVKGTNTDVSDIIYVFNASSKKTVGDGR